MEVKNRKPEAKLIVEEKREAEPEWTCSGL
jgi:hypothetical protein